MQIKLLVDGGVMKPGPAVGQKLGPLGVNIGQVVQEVNKATASFKGIKVPVELDINPKTKSFTVQVFSPPTSELLKKELNLEKASGDHKKLKAGNASIEQIISIAKTKHQNLLDRDFKSAVKSVAGTAGSLGMLIENKEYKDIEREIEKGKFDSEINSKKTETSPEKRKRLDIFFKKLHKAQEEAIAEEEAEKEAAEKAKEEEAEKAEGAEEEKKEGEEVEEAEEEAEEKK